MTTFNKFSKIGQFRHVMKELNRSGVLDYVTRPITFTGTVKLHGTNAAIGLKSTGEVYYQSRNRLITPTSDNMGFAYHMDALRLDGSLSPFLDAVKSKIGRLWPEADALVYGEWCGQGIQRGMGISEAPKMFVVFSVKINDGENLFEVGAEEIRDVKLEEHRIFNIYDFPTFETTIDFHDREQMTKALDGVADMTETVAKECPVAKALGYSGLGEGIVWRACLPDGRSLSTRFKTVGAELDNNPKAKKAKRPPMTPEQAAGITEFVDTYANERRMQQGIEYLNEMGLPDDEPQSVGKFIGWVCKDVMNEESDTVVASDLPVKPTSKAIADKARSWYFKRMNG